jgi:hypothetical protein
MDAEGRPDEANGVRLFIVGTGGGNLRPFENPPLPPTATRQADSWGVLKLDLQSTGYDWTLLPVSGSSYSDSGTGTCH